MYAGKRRHSGARDAQVERNIKTACCERGGDVKSGLRSLAAAQEICCETLCSCSAETCTTPATARINPSHLAVGVCILRARGGVTSRCAAVSRELFFPVVFLCRSAGAYRAPECRILARNGLSVRSAASLLERRGSQEITSRRQSGSELRSPALLRPTSAAVGCPSRCISVLQSSHCARPLLHRYRFLPPVCAASGCRTSTARTCGATSWNGI